MASFGRRLCFPAHRFVFLEAHQALIDHLLSTTGRFVIIYLHEQIFSSLPHDLLVKRRGMVSMTSVDLQSHSGTAPETSRNAFGTNQVTNEDDSQSDHHPEASIFHNQTTQNSGPEVGHDMVTWVHEKVTNCSPSTS